MSPEQAEGQLAGPPSDVFSLGCVLAYAATATAPFGGGSAASILYRVVTATPDLNGVPASLRQVITACLAKNPMERIGLDQLGPMIGALGPPISGTLGAYWPEPLASIIAADHTHPVTQVSAPVSQPPASQPPVSQPPVSQVMAQPGSFPPGATPGFTGHAPMVADGYYAAATYLGAANPAAPGPVASNPAPAQPQYADPQYPGRQYADPRYPNSQNPQPGYAQPGTWQQPSAAAPSTNLASQYAAPSWPQQAAQAPAPTTPWPGQQPASGGSWPGAGQPSGPGGPSGPVSGPGSPSAGTPLAQYALGSGPQWRPTKAQIPPPVLGSIRLMYIGAAATVAGLIVGAVIASRDNTDWVKHQNARRLAVRVAAQHNHTMAGTLDATTVFGGAVAIVCWLVIARALRRGRSWTRITGTVLLALNTASLLTVLLATHNDPGVKTASLLVWIIGLAATIPLWGRQASNFFQAWRRR